MKATLLTVLLWSGFISPAFAQHDSIEPSTAGIVQIAVGASSSSSSSLTKILPDRGSSRRLRAVMSHQNYPALEIEPAQFQESSFARIEDPSSFNATQPKSKLLINPDQFWTRKSRPVIDTRGEGLFGDPRTACDEWRGFCGCCGVKTNPGHLGQKWLGNGDPCECVDGCCPAKRDRGCQQRQCESCPTCRQDISD